MAKPNKAAAQLKFGRYNALTKLGQGAMATVYLAEDPALNRMVAIKAIHSHLSANTNLLDRFTVEAKTAAGLRNPNIVEIFDYGLEGDLQYLVMEYIDGPNLQFILNLLGGQPMEPEVAAAIIFQAAEGLITADKHNVVHRDIKPENMMFMSDGKLKIADFGIAHISEQNLTQTGSILGSPNFMSPEQIDGKKPTHQTDMFSLGSVFYYCLAGRKPFTGGNIPTIMRNICDLPHASLVTIVPDIDPVLENLVETLLQKKPEDRGGGARWLSLQLRTYLNQKGIHDPAELTKDYLDKIGKMGNQTVIDLSQPLSSAGSEEESKVKTPLKPGQKMVKQKPGTKSASGSGSGSGSGVGSGSGSGVKPGTWQAGSATGEDLSFSGQTGGKSSGNKNRSGTGNSDKKFPLLWVGIGVALFVVVLSVILMLVFNSSGSKTKLGENAAPTLMVQSISLQPGSMELTKNQSRKILVDVQPQTASNNVRWQSSDVAIATVQDGDVTGVAPGKAIIKAISMQDSTKVGLAEVTVNNPVAEAASNSVTTPTIQNQSKVTTTKLNPKLNAKPDETHEEENKLSQDFAKSDNEKPAVEKPVAEKPASNKGLLTVTSAPPFAEVIVDGRFAGTTPVKEKELSFGKHKIQVTHRSFPDIDTTIIIGAGQKTLHFRLFHQ